MPFRARFHLPFMLPPSSPSLYVLLNNTLYWFTKSDSVEGKHMLRISALIHTPCIPTPHPQQRDLSDQLNSLHWHPITPAVKFQNSNSLQDLTGSGVWPQLFLCPCQLVFQFLKLAPAWAVAFALPYTRKTLHICLPVIIRSQLQCHLFLTTMVKPPSQSPSNTKLCFIVNTNFFGTPF